MSESLVNHIIDAIGEAARYGDIHGDGDGNASMSSESWFALRSHLSVILAAAHAKGRAEGIGEAVKIAAILDVGLSEIDDLFSDIRNDWSDPRSECRQGWAAVESMRGLLRALLTTGGTDAKR